MIYCMLNFGSLKNNHYDWNDILHIEFWEHEEFKVLKVEEIVLWLVWNERPSQRNKRHKQYENEFFHHTKLHKKKYFNSYMSIQISYMNANNIYIQIHYNLFLLLEKHIDNKCSYAECLRI